MDRGWSADFSYAYFRRLLNIINSRYASHVFGEAPKALGAEGRPMLFLRHDIDVDLRPALRMAEIENRFGVRATYMVMTSSPLYNLRQPASRQIVRDLMRLGHEVGLHFDYPPDVREGGPHDPVAVEACIVAAIEELEDTLGTAVTSLSYHRPLQWLLRGPLIIHGRVNSYASELMKWYLSDSKGSWREGDPIPEVEQARSHTLQLLIHPIWWGEIHMAPRDRLEEFFQTATHGQSPTQARAFDMALAATLPAVKRRGFVVEEHTAHADAAS